LFAAFLSAFLIFTITQLQPNSTDISKDILLHISLQLSNSSVPAYVEPQFIVPPKVAAINTLLFASLALVLIDAYLAMLTKSWLRDFDQSWRSLNDPKERARTREMRIQGLERWKLAWVVALLPLLIQGSLVLFGIALLILLFDLHHPTAYTTLAIFAAAVCFYFCTSVASALDKNAPFTSPLSRALEALCSLLRQCRSLWLRVYPRHMRHDSSVSLILRMVVGIVVVVGAVVVMAIIQDVIVVQVVVMAVVLVLVVVFIIFKLNPIILIWRLFFRDVSGEDPADAMVEFHSVEGAEIHCAISKRLYSATFKAVENFPVFIELFDQWVHTPSLRPLSVSDWYEVLPLVKPYLLSPSLFNELGPLPVARLLLCSDSDEFPSERKTIITSLGKGPGNTTESPSIKQMYIHLLGSPESDWSLAGQVVRELDADSDTTIELRWILNWITFRYLIQSKEFSNDDGLSWVSTIRNIIPFLRSTTIYIIQNRLVNDDDKLFNSLLLITRAVADASKEAGGPDPIQKVIKSPEQNHEGLFISIGNRVVSLGHQWDFIRGLYAASSTVAGFRREFTQLVILLLIGALSTVDESGISLSVSFIDTEKDLAILMDALWETWQATRIDRHLLTGIAVWLLQQGSGLFHKPLPNGQQRRFQDLLNAYDIYMGGATHSMNSNTLRFIEVALSFSLETDKASDGDGKWEPQTLELKNPWLVMHIHNILGHNWRIPKSEMSEAVHGQLEWREQFKRFTWYMDDRHDALGRLHVQWIDSPRVLSLPSMADSPVVPSLGSASPSPLDSPAVPSLGSPRVLSLPSMADSPVVPSLGSPRVLRPPSLDSSVVLIPPSLDSPGAREASEALDPLEWYKDGRRDALDELDRLGVRDALEALDTLDALEWCEWREWLEGRERLERRELREWLELQERRKTVEWREWRKRLKGAEWRQWLESHEGLERREWSEGGKGGEWRELLVWRKRLETREWREWRELHELREWDELRERLGLREWREFYRCLCRTSAVDKWRVDKWRERVKDWEWYSVLLRTRRRDLLEQCVWRKRRAQQSPPALEIIARSQLDLYHAKKLRPDPLALSLFLSQRKEDIFNDSRRFILQFFGSTPSAPSLAPSDPTEQEEVDPATARQLCSDFFDSKAVGDVTKWRLLTSVVFPEWKTLSTLWKDLLAREVTKMVWEGDRRVDWMARVTPELAGTFNLYEFGLSENDPTHGSLVPTHLQMVATVVEYLGQEGLTYGKARGLEEVLGQHLNILGDEDAPGRIRTVIDHVMQPDALEYLAVLFDDQT
jgi:hypothetical protein